MTDETAQEGRRNQRNEFETRGKAALAQQRSGGLERGGGRGVRGRGEEKASVSEIGGER